MSDYINPDQLPFVYTATGAVPINTVAFDWDLEGIESPSLALHLTNVGAGAVFRIQVSSDQVNWALGRLESSSVGSTASDFNGTGLYVVPKTARFVRLYYLAAQTSGTTRIAITESYATPINTVSLGGTVNVVGNVGAVAQGTGAHDAAVAGFPVRTAARAITANYTAVANGDTADAISTLVGAQIFKPYSIPEADWVYAAAAGGLITNTSTAAKAAVASNRNYVTGVQVRNVNAVATEFVILDGSTVIWRTQLPANQTGTTIATFNTPLKSTVNAAINIQCVTTGAQVYANLQGYVAP